MAAFTPTPEQEDIRAAYASGDTLVVEALAGTGKTTTLKMLANDNLGTQMTYVAFNRAIAGEAKRTFPRNVTARTMHSFAYAAAGAKFEARMNAGKVPAWKVKDILGIPSSGFSFGKFSLRDGQVGRLVNESVARFCHSADPAPALNHMPHVPGLDTMAARAQLATFLLPFVEKAWEDLQDPKGRLNFSHDVYLKLWSMAPKCELPGEVVLFDEAQDADPVILHIVNRQLERGLRVVPVGDANQQIYAWRGAVNALDKFQAKHRLPLQKSFRFGPEIADRANLLLETLGTDLRLEGHEPVGSRLATLAEPQAVLCRTNSGVISELIRAQAQKIPTAVVGGTGAVESLAKAAQDLMNGKKTWHSDLMAFDDWQQVRAYVKDHPQESQDIAVIVRLIDNYGTEVLLDIAGRAVPESEAQRVISTAHKAKGREWDRVQISNDFTDPRDEGGEWNRGELRLQYVAVTRAQGLLDDTVMPWLDELAGGPADRLAASEVTPLVIEEIRVRVVEHEQVVCDPESETRLVMHKTKYDQNLVADQRNLPGRQYKNEYCGMSKCNIVSATPAALLLAERYGLTVSDRARERVAALDPA